MHDQVVGLTMSCGAADSRVLGGVANADSLRSLAAISVYTV